MPADIGVFVPVGNNGWLISENAPQYEPSFTLSKQIVQKAEGYGLDFALSMIKLRGFGGKTKFWDHNLESFTLMSALAACTSKIQLVASTAILTLPPAIVARMAVTLDSIAPGRIGVNIVTGWQSAEYEQMGLWPGDQYFGQRYQYATEYVQVMKDLWGKGVSDLEGQHFKMDDCKLGPLPSSPIKIVAAGQSGRGVEFASQYADYNFSMGVGYNTPTAFGKGLEPLIEAAEKAGRDVGAYVLFMCIAEETDEAAEKKWNLYRDGLDVDAVAWMHGQAGKDKQADDRASVTKAVLPEGAVNMNMGTLVGSYGKVAAMLDEIAMVPGTKGIMLTFDDFLIGLDKFGQKIQPLMKTRASKGVS